jgi:hypothetical protein
MMHPAIRENIRREANRIVKCFFIFPPHIQIMLFEDIINVNPSSNAKEAAFDFRFIF